MLYYLGDNATAYTNTNADANADAVLVQEIYLGAYGNTGTSQCLAYLYQFN